MSTEVRLWKPECIQSSLQVVSDYTWGEMENQNSKGDIWPLTKAWRAVFVFQCLLSVTVLWKMSGVWETLLNYKIRIERIEMFGGDCSHQDQIQRKERGFCTRELGFSSGLEFSQESGIQSLSAHEQFMRDFWPCLKLTFRNWCPPS